MQLLVPDVSEQKVQMQQDIVTPICMMTHKEQLKT